jgi:diguanylate cyclase (GGDEF)-like protein/PAS domain S-box-containing protein
MKINLNKLNEAYRNFIDKSPHLFFSTDLKGNFLFINKAAEKITGLKLAELQKSNLENVVVHEYQDSIKKLFQDNFKIENIPPLEVEVVDSSGNRIPLEIQLIGVKDKNGKPATLQWMAREISERKKARKKIEQLYKKAHDTRSIFMSVLNSTENIAVQGYNIKGEVIFWNQFSEKLFGFTENEVKGKTLEEFLLSESDEKEFKKHIKNVIQNTKPSPLTEWRTKTKTGDIRHILCFIFPSLLEDRDPMAIAMVADITEAKKAQEKINEILNQLERFSEISADILSIKDEEKLFDRIAQAVIDISDYRRVLISYFIDTPPYREIIGHKGVKRADLERVKKIKMPREKYLEYFRKGIKIGNNSSYIPHTLKNILDQKAVIYGETPYPVKEGRWHKEDNLLVPMKDTKGKMIGVISIDESKSGLVPTEETVKPLEIFSNLMSEVIQKHKLAKKISESEEKYRDLVTNIKIGIFRAAPDGKILEANPAALEMFGYLDSAQFLNLRISSLFPNPDDYNTLIKNIEEKGYVKDFDRSLIRRNRTQFWASIISTAVKDSSGKTLYYDTVIEDITERKKLEQQVQRLSETDELTTLYNRRYFNQNLPKEIKKAEIWRSALSIIMVDIDNLKQYNDLYLHLEGDKILRGTAQNISNTLRKEGDWVTRYGGDEFVVILPGTNASQAGIVAERIRKISSELEFHLKGDKVRITVSAGVASFYYLDSALASGSSSKDKITQTDYEKIANELIKLADEALRDAKQSGRNKVVISTKAIELSRITK